MDDVSKQLVNKAIRCCSELLYTHQIAIKNTGHALRNVSSDTVGLLGDEDKTTLLKGLEVLETKLSLLKETKIELRMVRDVLKMVYGGIVSEAAADILFESSNISLIPLASKRCGSFDYSLKSVAEAIISAAESASEAEDDSKAKDDFEEDDFEEDYLDDDDY